ncbi:MAG: RdgB/HAM1 family non-canonical purine NTP pyrophosphatase [Gammaproteobacteria bacterium]|nr:RdgB/HAM1 family non-canonical purine NTP pyrophosphatase [Gammaproteobacteria bacterium]MDH3373035.1 RdgB/HAM1 family non-canonical purine NTP pyrophosphatase [Gammaproteobacteria bacterium]MDH3408009.1 RdgB/HAM1 family non-canonical purine NTP pyrophosphatase [Gammaproteobacteria bacterium]MDH3551648.1 RdgB/HAM1 family non-canonical purine NTP pyrophosphatase [Gammaproteobacteria bacterium]
MASSNAGKLREIAAILGDLDIEVVAQSEFGVTDADETGDTFVENALIKARHAAAATGFAAIADDSGLAVDALDGRPGVYSARYSGPDGDDEQNIDKLLAELNGVPDEERGAAFHCVACYVTAEGSEPIIAAAEWRGRILRKRRGDGGFGYDPVFFDPEIGCASAELSSEQKNARSHRGKALRELAHRLRELHSR